MRGTSSAKRPTAFRALVSPTRAMACPLCGERCSCSYAPPRERDASSILVDPEVFDPSEEAFAESLAQPAETPAKAQEAPLRPTYSRITFTPPEKTLPENGIEQLHDDEWFTGATAPQAGPSPDQWREEVASRVRAHRARRRGRGQSNHQSLALNFDPPTEREPESAATFDVPFTATATARNYQPARDVLSPMPAAVALAPAASVEELVADWIAAEETHEKAAEPAPECAIPQRFAPIFLDSPAPKIIEFPRLPTIAPPPVEELAEPVLETPRILEAADDMFDTIAPSSLAGIRLRTEEIEEAVEFELPLQVAPLGPRFYAAAMDGLIVAAAFALFAMIFVTIVRELPEKRLLIAGAVMVPGILWSIYQFLFLLLARTTPGLLMADLRLATFDGDPLPRYHRAGRAAATLLSAVSLGMGFAWALIDEDHLSWHDRITRTYVQQK